MHVSQQAATCTRVVLEEIYRGCHQLTLAELRVHLENIACAGSSPSLDRDIWSIKEMEWDIEHLILAVDYLGLYGEQP